MAVYKVPQDVEAEDKLIGPFSFRQFIYLIIAAMAGFLAYAFGRLFWALGIIPAPVAIFFLVLALPLKKDQPMETYLTAIVHFLLKPRTRLWDPEGELNLVEITAPKVNEGPTIKDFSGREASARLQYLSQIVDTGGWASRGLTSPMDNVSLSDTVVAEAQSAEDILDTSGSVSQNVDSLIAQRDEQRRTEMIQTMRAAVQPPAPRAVTPPSPPQQAPVAAQPAPAASQDAHLVYNPYPSSMHQKVLTPSSALPSEPSTTPANTTVASPAKQAQAPSEEAVSPDIMRLATSKDLSISTIAREAERLQKKHLEDEEEVVISLR